jgi:serine/threonine-protein kinase
VIPLPARIGKYELVEFLGGGMSHVFRAHDTVIDRTVAVKILTDEACSDPEARTRFLHEAQVAARFNQDNILAVYDFGEEQGRPFLVMEFVAGLDLRKVIEQNSAGDSRNKLRLALQIARAIGYIHARNVIHRDVKPENIRINSDGNAKIFDFGIAKSENSPATRAGYIVGSPYYMAPEQVRGEQLTPRVDVYAFGMLLFELFTGVKAIQADSYERIFYCILNEPLDLSPLDRISAPAGLKELVQLCTAKAPGDRIRDFDTITRRLEQMEEPARSDNTTAPRVEGTLMAQVRAALSQVPRLVWAIAAVILVPLIGTAVYLAGRPDKPPPPPPPPPKVAQLAPVLDSDTGRMLLVAAGTFLFDEEKASVHLPAFYIDETEVSNEAFARFCTATGRSLPRHFDRTHPNFPVVGVTVEDARAFAHWAGKRLPTGKEWEKAARGTDGRIYPWGDSTASPPANIDGKRLMPVDAFPDGKSPYGVLNMAGNVWELIDEPLEPDKKELAIFKDELKLAGTAHVSWITVRGGAYNRELEAAITFEWMAIPASHSDEFIGFRCVKDPVSQVVDPIPARQLVR